MAAFSIQGTQWSVTISSTPTDIPGVTSFSLEQGERNSIITTAISDSSEQKLAGFTGAGTLTLELNWDPANAAHADLFLSSTQSGSTANRTVTCTMSDTGAAVVSMTAFVTNFAINGAVNEPGQATVTLELASAYTITP
jgi:hypothetical protein